MTAIETDWGKIIVWVVIWLVGYALGLWEAAIKNKSKAKKSEKEIKLLKEQVDNFEPVQEISEPTSLSVFERASGGLKMRIDGEMFETNADINFEKRARLLKLVIAMRPWLEKEAEKKKTTTSVARPVPIPAPAPIQTPAPIKIKKAATPIENSKNQLKARSEEITVSNLSMVEQIDLILQKKLDGSLLDKQGIQLRTSISGDILIKVGLTEFEWIDEVPDEAIQLAIRESIAEWEKNAISGS